MDGEDEPFDLNTLASVVGEINSITHLSLPPGMSALTRAIFEGPESQPDYGIQPSEEFRSDNKIDINIAASTATLAEPLINDLEEEEKRLVSFAIMNLSNSLNEHNPDATVDQCVQTSIQLLGTADQMYSQSGMMKILLVSSQNDFSHHRWVFHIVYSDYTHLIQNKGSELQSHWMPGLSTNTEYYARLYAWSEIEDDKHGRQMPADIGPQIPIFPTNEILLSASDFMINDVNEVRELVRNGDLTEEVAKQFAEELATLKVRSIKNRSSIENINIEKLEDSLKDMILTPV